MHLPEGWTKIELEAGGALPVTWDTPTNTIPIALRRIGSRIWLEGAFPAPGPDAKPVDLHRLVANSQPTVREPDS